jgi:hypothetical protein
MGFQFALLLPLGEFKCPFPLTSLPVLGFIDLLLLADLMRKDLLNMDSDL